MTRTVLVTGATGTVSTALRTALEGADVDIRALVRDPAKAAALTGPAAQVVVADLDDPGSLPPAFDGVQDLWLLVANGPRAAENSMNALWAARQAGVERVVRLSAVGAAHDAPTRGGRLHALSDHELRQSGLRWTILRPHWFMQNLLNEAGDVSARRSFSLNAGSGRLGMVDIRDVAELAARVLTDDTGRHDGRTYVPTGPRAVSFADVARGFGRVLGAEVDYVPVNDGSKRAMLLDHGVPAWSADLIIEYLRAYATGWGDFTTTDVHTVLGRPPRDVEAFIRDHSDAFA